MSRDVAVYRDALPQLAHRQPFLTDGGLETTLVFLESWELPEFAAFPLLDSPSGRASLAAYYERYISLALERQTGFVLESPTWRASPRWGARLGFDSDSLALLNRQAIALLAALRDRHSSASTPMVISGCIGPQDDGYQPSQLLNTDAAQAYHSFQAEAFAQTAADMLCAVTMTYADEAIGVTRAAAAVDMPVAISFTVETDGRLPSGENLPDAIAAVDDACAQPPAYYMINCAHPTHFRSTVCNGGDWRARIRGLRVNASCKSHAELDEMTELDQGDPGTLGAAHRELLAAMPGVCVLGGCCGTTEAHVAAIAASCLP